ncbi:dihydroxyacetone kinase, subunit I/II domain protein [[Clostridium] sordellii ATCC 9714]|nr:dihydroxyacetone kinase, subunit I/II domain protein [[Clostridium] sordellii ATCC 9714] [Paeniclostridium sordellii ATCC 9714]
MTSIDMEGASISILKLDDELKNLLSQVSDTPAFKVSGPVESVEYVDIYEDNKCTENATFEVETNIDFSKIENNILTLDNMIYIVDKMSEVIIKMKFHFVN